MSDPRRVLELFEQALGFDPAARAAWLDSACLGNHALRRELDELIAADAQAEDFLASPFQLQSDRSGELLGVWRLEKLLGSGGMGSVYSAARADGAYDKLVAIKFLLFDAGDLRRRFALEQRILGALTHPNIAGLLDVGNDARGAPYIVMEYVDGEPITSYVQKRALDQRASIALFLPILDAIQTAHSQLIVHRDIKPSNVLIDQHGHPKLLDFGIAKLLDTSTVATTRTGLGPLTPEYASPEQVRGDAIGTPSDIYSLGVLLYELVTGARPYKISDTSPSAIERTVCTVEPTRPSARASVPAGANPRDLDAVILKALEKQPARRYGSCAEFAADLQRWLDGNTVVAREPSQRERVARYLRQHRLGVSVVAAVTLALLIGFGTALWQAVVAREQTRIARLERDRAQSVTRFLTDTLSAAKPSDLGRRATVIDVLDRARKLADIELGNDPATAVSTHLALAKTYLALGDMDLAEGTAQAANQAALSLGDHVAQIETLLTLGDIQLERKNTARARELLNQARALALDYGTPLQRGISALRIADLEGDDDNAKLADRWLDQAMLELPDAAAYERASALNGYATHKQDEGDPVAAIDYERQAIALMERTYPRGHPDTLMFSINLAAILGDQKRFDEAIPLFKETIEKQSAMLGDDNADVIWARGLLVWSYNQQSKYTEALPYALLAYDGAKHLPDDNSWKADTFIKYAMLLVKLDRASDAIPILRKALSIYQTVLPPGHYLIDMADSYLGTALSAVGERAQGEAMARLAYDRLVEKDGAQSSHAKVAKTNIETIEAMSPGVSAHAAEATKH